MVRVIESSSSEKKTTMQQTYDMWSGINWEMVIGLIAIGVFVIIIIGLIVWFLIWLKKKANEDKKAKQDGEYNKYKMDIKMCRLNADKRYRYKSWYTCWLFYKRCPVYAQTSSGKRLVGYYDGQAVKKEGWFIFGLLQKHSLFDKETDVVIMPYDWKKIIWKKNDDFSITIEAEGIDETMSSEYYSIPVLFNPENKKANDKKFIDFSNMIIKEYFEEFVYRDIIKEKIKESSVAIKKATEMNAEIQVKRKSGSNLTE